MQARSCGGLAVFLAAGLLSACADVDHDGEITSRLELTPEGDLPTLLAAGIVFEFGVS